MSALRVGHVWCRVDDLYAAVADFVDLGFTVSWGADPASAHNALIWFREGPFLEISQVPRALGLARLPMSMRYGRATGERIAAWAGRGASGYDLAVETDETHLDAVRTRLRRRGVPVGKVCRGRRIPPDGQPVSYEFLAVSPARLPFVVSAYVPLQRPADIVHANGATGVHAVHYGLAPDDRQVFDAVVEDRRWIVTHDAERSGVVGIELAGLDSPLDRSRLHGVALGVPA